VQEAGPISAPTTSLAFIAPTARVAVHPGETAFITSSAAIGAGVNTNGGRSLELDVCYRQVNGDIARIGVPVTGLSAAPTYEQLYTLSAVRSGLPAGSYDFALCGSTVDAPDWSLLGDGQTAVQVFKTS
jgi:hypothetical protein